MNLQDLLEKINTPHPDEIKMGLDRIRQVAQGFIPLNFPCPVVTIGGTNGKGSTVAVLSALAQAAGMKVATYTSPHLIRFNERIQINGIEISDDNLLEVLQAVEQARDNCPLTFFEFTTLAALRYFHDQAPDLIILEVGMGGRLDATNLIDADIAVITSIGLDHMLHLGNTKEAIAQEKAGIMRSGKPIICGEIPLQAFLLGLAQENQAIFYGLGQDFFLLDTLSSPLVPSNIACAAQAASLLGIPVNTSVIESVRVAGRQQEIQYQGKSVILDVAHNEDSLQELVRFLKEKSPSKIHLVLGMMQDKKMGNALVSLTDLCTTIHLASPQTPRSMKTEQLIDLIDASCQAYASVSDACAAALAHAKSDEIVVVTGSFYTVCEANML